MTKRKFLYSFALLPLLAVVRCDNEKEQYIQAEFVQQLSSYETTNESLRPQIAKWIQVGNQINIQGQALTPDELKTTAQIDGLVQVYNDWQKLLLEAVQNNEMGNLTAAKQLDILGDLDKQLSFIQAQLDNLNKK